MVSMKSQCVVLRNTVEANQPTFSPQNKGKQGNNFLFPWYFIV